jgi:PilZ domain
MKAHAVAGPDVIGMLARSVPTRLIDISRTGCLLESRQRVDEGSVGELRLDVEREVFVDDVRITRCVLVKGSGSVYRVGAEFLQTHRPGERSIRLAVGTILRRLATGHRPRRVRDASELREGDGQGTTSPATVKRVPSTKEERS